MAAKRWYLVNGVDANGWQALSETAQAAATCSAGWVVGTGLTNSSELQSNAERSAGFTANTVPDGTLDTTLKDAFRTPVLNGTFAAANWVVQFAVVSTVQAGAADGQIVFRLIKADADGSNATLLTAAQQTASVCTNVGATDINGTLTFAPGAITITNQYLFVQVAWKRTGAGGMTTTNIRLRTGSAATPVGTSLLSADFTPGTQAVTGGHRLSAARLHAADGFSLGTGGTTTYQIANVTGYNYGFTFSGQGGALVGVQLSLERVAATDGVYIEVRQDTFTGTLLATSPTRTASSIYEGFQSFYDFWFDPVDLSRTTTYWVKFFRVDASGGGTYRLYTKDGHPYDRGTGVDASGNPMLPLPTFVLYSSPGLDVRIEQPVTGVTLASTATLFGPTVALAGDGFTVVSRVHAEALSGTSLATAATNHAAGHLLIALIHENNGAGFGVSDLAGSTWVDAGLTLLSTARIKYALSTPGHAANVVTLAIPGGTGYAGLTVYDVDPHGGTVTLADAEEAAAIGGSPLETAALSLTDAHGFVAALVQINSGEGAIGGPGFTLTNQSGLEGTLGGTYHADEYQSVTAATVASATPGYGDSSMGIIAAMFQVAVVPSALPFYDDCTGTSGTLKPEWTAFAGTPQYTGSGKMVGTSGGYNVARFDGTGEVPGADQYLQCLTDGTSDVAVGTRLAFPSGTFSGYLFWASDTFCGLYRYDAGSEVELQTFSVLTAPATIRLESEGTTHRCYINGVQVGTDEVDATYTTGPVIVAIYNLGTSPQVDDIELGNYVPPGGGGAVTTAFLASTAVLTAPTVAPGPVTVTGATLASTLAAFALTVAAGAVGVTGAHRATTIAVTAPSVAPGPVTITAGTRPLTSQVNVPTIAPGPVAVITGTRATTIAVNAPTLAVGAVSVTTAHRTTTSSVNAPGLTAQTLGATIPSGSGAFPPSVALNITTAPRGSTAQLFDPAIIASGAVGVVFLPATSAAFAPTVAPGAVTVTTATRTTTIQVFAPSLTVGPVTVTGAHRATTIQVFAPTLAPGAVTVVGASRATTHQVFPPSLTVGPASVTTATIAATSQVFLPIVAEPGVVNIGAATVPSTAQLYGLTVTTGPVSVTTATLATTAQLFLPTVAVAGVTAVTAGTRPSTAQLYAPTVAPGAVSVTGATRASTIQVQAPSLTALALGATITSGSGAFPPAVAVRVTTAHRGSTVQLYAPAVVPGTPTITLPTLPSTVVLYGPVVTSGGLAGTVLLGTIPSTGGAFPPALARLPPGPPCTAGGMTPDILPAGRRPVAWRRK